MRNIRARARDILPLNRSIDAGLFVGLIEITDYTQRIDDYYQLRHNLEILWNFHRYMLNAHAQSNYLVISYFHGIIMNLQFTACNEHANEIKTDKFSVPKTIINKIIGTLDAYGRRTAHFFFCMRCTDNLGGSGHFPQWGDLAICRQESQDLNEIILRLEMWSTPANHSAVCTAPLAWDCFIRCHSDITPKGRSSAIISIIFLHISGWRRRHSN